MPRKPLAPKTDRKPRPHVTPIRSRLLFKSQDETVQAIEQDGRLRLSIVTAHSSAFLAPLEVAQLLGACRVFLASVKGVLSDDAPADDARV